MPWSFSQTCSVAHPTAVRGLSSLELRPGLLQSSVEVVLVVSWSGELAQAGWQCDPSRTQAQIPQLVPDDSTLLGSGRHPTVTLASLHCMWVEVPAQTRLGSSFVVEAIVEGGSASAWRQHWSAVEQRLVGRLVV
jgi:hypothetical protein